MDTVAVALSTTSARATEPAPLPDVGLPDDVATLLDRPLDEMMSAAAARRDAVTGTRVTYSPKVFIPLTMLCRDSCGYCTFAQPPARLAAPFLTPDEVLAIARRGARHGCHEALFTLGEAPEERYEVAATWLRVTRDAIAACACRDGCPSCVYSPKCGNGNEPLDKAMALVLLRELMSEPDQA
jgi:2-iminoacetate synthase ThiH